MKAERLAEWQKFAEDARGALIKWEGTKLGQDGMMGFVELIDALTAERARAEKAEAKFTEADRRLDLAIKWIADSRWDSAGAARLLNQIDIPYQKELSK